MKKNDKNKSSIVIDIEYTNSDETMHSRKHIKAEGSIPSLFVAFYSFLTLITFEGIVDWFISGIKRIIGKLRKHNYYCYGF